MLPTSYAASIGAWDGFWRAYGRVFAQDPPSNTTLVFIFLKPYKHYKLLNPQKIIP